MAYVWHSDTAVWSTDYFSAIGQVARTTTVKVSTVVTLKARACGKIVNYALSSFYLEYLLLLLKDRAAPNNTWTRRLLSPSNANAEFSTKTHIPFSSSSFPISATKGSFGNNLPFPKTDP